MAIVEVDRRDDAVTVVTLNRPESLNALSFEMVEEIHRVLSDIEDDNSCRVVVLTGAGRGFCSGLDLKNTGTAPTSKGLRGPAASMRSQEYIASLSTRIHRLPQPVIAAVNGPAFGGGMAIAAAADIRIASESARFGVQFIKIGVSGCDIGISYLLPRLVGAARATELIMTAREFRAAEAERIGFVTQVVPDDDLVPTALTLAGTLNGYSPFALAMTKQVLAVNIAAPSLEAAIQLENRTQTLAGTGGDLAEAAAAFVEKRAPRWGS
jgi:enoyl-CoA hydratase/carnithine racemase